MPPFNYYGNLYGDLYGDQFPEIGASLASEAGGSLVLDYRADPGYWTPGTAPDVAAAANQAPGGPSVDVSQTTEPQRPHSTTDADGFPAWDFTPNQRLRSAVVSAYAAANSEATLMVVGRFDGAGNYQFVESTVSPSLNGGLSIFSIGNDLYGRVYRQGGSSDAIISGFHGGTPDTDLHLFRLTGTQAGGVSIRVDEGTPTTVAGDGRLQFDQTVITLGANLGNSLHMDGALNRVSLLVNPTAAQITASAAYLMDAYNLS